MAQDKLPSASRAARISPKIRRAIELRVTKGRTIKEACEEAGLSVSGWHKAMRRPAVFELFRGAQERFVVEYDLRRNALRLDALDAAQDLMKNAKSETVRARMAEFLAAQDKEPAAPVQVNVGTAFSGGYEFARQGQRVVEVIEGKAHTGD